MIPGKVYVMRLKLPNEPVSYAMPTSIKGIKDVIEGIGAAKAAMKIAATFATLGVEDSLLVILESDEYKDTPLFGTEIEIIPFVWDIFGWRIDK